MQAHASAELLCVKGALCSLYRWHTPMRVCRQREHFKFTGSTAGCSNILKELMATILWRELTGLDRGRRLLLVVSVCLLALGIALAIYGNTLPKDLGIYGRYISGGPKRGETNLTTTIGLILILYNIGLINLALFSKDKKDKQSSKQKPQSSQEHQALL